MIMLIVNLLMLDNNNNFKNIECFNARSTHDCEDMWTDLTVF